MASFGAAGSGGTLTSGGAPNSDDAFHQFMRRFLDAHTLPTTATAAAVITTSGGASGGAAAATVVTAPHLLASEHVEYRPPNAVIKRRGRWAQVVQASRSAPQYDRVWVETDDDEADDSAGAAPPSHTRYPYTERKTEVGSVGSGGGGGGGGSGGGGGNPQYSQVPPSHQPRRRPRPSAENTSSHRSRSASPTQTTESDREREYDRDSK